MKDYILKISLKSDTLIGSGSGFGATIDSDVIFDTHGLPFIPAKRIKGCLVDSFREVKDMFEKVSVVDFGDIEKTFGTQGQENPAEVYFENLYLKSYNDLKQWMEYLNYKDHYPEFFNSNSIIELMTSKRRQTTIKNGVAKDTSLRTQRVLNKGLEFFGNVKVTIQDFIMIEQTLALACKNLKSMGTKRNRGLGEVICELYEDNIDITHKVLEKFKGANHA